jgi:hypothetical protein
MRFPFSDIGGYSGAIFSSGIVVSTGLTRLEIFREGDFLEI